jgi:threonine dehydrogenase-like Zn-dependent dehydrogenase
MHGAGDVRIEDVPDAKLADPTDALIRITRACICGSDLWPYKSMEPTDGGRPMGHEAIGVVEEIGAEVSTVKAGDLVVMPFAFSDGTCLFCEDGLQTECVHGGFSAAARSAAPRPRRSAFRRPTGRSTRSRPIPTRR